MKSLTRGFSLLVCFATLCPAAGPAQWGYFEPPKTPDAQRTALNSVRSRVNWLQNSTRTASNFGEQGYGSVWRSFHELRLEFGTFTQTLTPQQAAYGADDLDELNTGLDIIEQAFANYQEDVAAGHSADAALANLCRVVRQGSTLWLQQLNKTSSRLKIGWR